VRRGAGGKVRGGEKAYNPGSVSTPTQNLSHPAFPQPDNPKVRVWRYIDFPKFVAWLINGTLVLRRVNLLDDKREGHHGKFFFHLAFVTAFHQMEAAKDPPTHAERERAATEKAHEALRDVERNRLASFVSCWRGGDTESEAMWRIYAGGGASVALVLPYERLRDSLPKGSGLYIGRVTYFDFNSRVVPPGNVYGATMSKSEQFDYEREIRIVEHVSTIWSHDNVPEGVPSAADPPEIRTVPWVIADHVERVVISPYAARWQADAIREVVQRLSPGLEARVRDSEMTWHDPPRRG
jgi:hypothetical protein